MEGTNQGSRQVSKLKRSVRRIAPVLWMGVIFFLSAQPTLPVIIPSTNDLQSIIGHVSVYAVLAWLIRDALDTAGVRHSWIAAILLCALYGVSDEYHQSFVPNRAPDSFDVAMDVLGAILGGVVLPGWLRRRARAS